MPLTGAVVFKAVLQRENRVQVPRLLRWQYRMESDQVLSVEVRNVESFGTERFLGRMMRDGRLTIPKLTLRLLQGGEESSLVGAVLEVTVEPAEERGEKLNP